MVAEGVGFEPTLRFPVNTLSKRAPSATRPPLLSSRNCARLLHKDERAARLCAFSHSAAPPHQLINRSCRRGQAFSSRVSADPTRTVHTWHFVHLYLHIYVFISYIDRLRNKG